MLQAQSATVASPVPRVWGDIFTLSSASLSGEIQEATMATSHGTFVISEQECVEGSSRSVCHVCFHFLECFQGKTSVQIFFLGLWLQFTKT